MALLIRFKIVEIDSLITFHGKKKRKLHYPVRSTSLVPDCKLPVNIRGPESLPEIFWQ